MSIDDPIKPEDAVFPLIRDKMNQRFKNTIQSRLARPDTPIVLIMQRVHEDDLAGFLLKGGSGEKWHHLIIPAEVEDDSPEYPAEYTHGIPIPYEAPLGYTWPLKVSGDYAQALKEDPIIWATQYQQTPTADQGEIFDASWWRHYEAYDPVNSEIVVSEFGERVSISYKAVYADTAMKTGERHDWSVFQLWARLADGRIALLDQERGKYEAPELLERFDAFCDRHRFQSMVNNMGVRHIKVEDKASGTGLIQSSRHNVDGIPRDKDKVSRAKSVAPQIKLGKVLLPRGAEWLQPYVTEFMRFNSMMTHAHDDQIDPTADAIMDMIITERVLIYSEVV
jgi:predicted phage terminase large subunit-like protein